MRVLRRRERALESWPLSSPVRDAWSAGPPAPSVDQLMAAIRPALLQIDGEHEAPSWLVQRFAGLRGRVARPVPMAMAVGGLAAAAVALLLAISPGGRLSLELAASPSLALDGPVTRVQAVHTAALGDLGSGSMIYDLEIEDRAAGTLLVFDGDGATIIWIGDTAESFDGVSLAPAAPTRSTASTGSTTGSRELI